VNFNILFLQSHCGWQFTGNLEEMFKDMELSADMLSKFRAQPSYSNNVGYNNTVFFQNYIYNALIFYAEHAI